MAAAVSRSCPVCESSERETLFTQHFMDFDGGSLLTGYDVVVCRACGFGFADGLPAQAAFDAYYREFSKYGFSDADDRESPQDVARLGPVAERLAQAVPSRSARVLEIGCASGQLLALLREHGLTNLTGWDPSPASAEIGRRRGLHIETRTLLGPPSDDQPFDLLILVGVLEHLHDLGPAAARLRALLARGGLLYLDVPDATRFAEWIDAPFQHFSIEHIGFFSRVSLRNLVAAHGFEEIWHLRDVAVHSEIARMPNVAALYRAGRSGAGAMERDTETVRGLSEYVQRSRELERRLSLRVAALAEADEGILVWGTGTLTRRLLATTRLAQVRIEAFVDSNPAYQHRTLAGRPVLAPDAIRTRREPILISSLVFESEITRQIRESLGCSNRILRLLEEPASGESR
jgi:SAM-dependent methyltransferase